MDNKFSKVVLALAALISFDAHSYKIWAENDHDFLKGKEGVGAYDSVWRQTFLTRGPYAHSNQMFRAPGDSVLYLGKYRILMGMPANHHLHYARLEELRPFIHTGQYEILEKIMTPKERAFIEKRHNSNAFFKNFVTSDQKSTDDNVYYVGQRKALRYGQQNSTNSFPNQSIQVESFNLLDPYQRFIAPSGTLMSVGFVGKQINTLYYGDKDRGLEMQSYVTSLANGVEHLDTYLKAFDKALDATRNKSRCDADIRAEVDWRQSKFAEFTHPAMAKLFAKADLSSIHDYNLNLAKYVKDRTLIVRSQKAAKDLKQSLAKLDVRYGSIRVAEGSDGFGAKPFDDTYFAVERTKEELDIYKADLLGYNKALDGFYEYRYGLINDVRFVADVSKRHPVDGIFQDIMRDRKVRDCLVSL